MAEIDPQSGVREGDKPAFLSEIRVVRDVPHAFARFVAEELDRALYRSTKGHGSEVGPYRIALSGGPTARACYEALAGEAGIDFGLLELYLSDERCVDTGSPDANATVVREALLDRVTPVPAFFPLSCAEGPESYSALLNSRPPLDLIHLGLGPDGHTASLFAGSKALEAFDDELVAYSSDPSATNPFPRITFTLAAIARARCVVFTVAGASKHDSLSALLRGGDIPATRIRAERVVVICDPPALGGDLAGLGAAEDSRLEPAAIASPVPGTAPAASSAQNASSATR